MTQQTINIGSAANDGTGDPLRTSFAKTNGNFTELYADVTAKVAKAGDTMSGDLSITKSIPTITLNKIDDSNINLVGRKNNNDRWGLQLGNSTAESSGNLGSWFTLSRYADNGAYLGSPIIIKRDDGKVQLAGDISVAGATASTSPTTGALTVAGGVGIGGNIYAGGGIEAQNVNLNKTDVPQLNFYKSNILQSSIQDNGSSFNCLSNAAGTTGMYILHGANAWTAISDARLPYKKTARPLSALDKLQHIALYENEVDGRLELFGKAQEIFQAFPHVVIKGDDDPDFTPTGMHNGKVWGVSYDRLGLVALQAVKELLAQVKQLEARIAALEAG